MTAHNVRVTSFDDGVTTFNALSAGVYVEDGPAGGPEVVRGRIRRIAGSGTKVSADGVGNLPVTPPAVQWTLVFVGANPAAHVQYVNLLNLTGHYGTLWGRVPGAIGWDIYTTPAILVGVNSTWKGPYGLGVRNTLLVVVEFELMAFWSAGS